ncbi:hypothetical protein LguiA_010468 [Lonicera macranthoides]
MPIRGKDLLDSIQDKKNDAYKMLLRIAKNYKLAEGIMVNNFKELEEGAIKALHEEEADDPPIYPIGPVTQTGSSSEVDGSECLKWLDDQPPSSVLLVSFQSDQKLNAVILMDWLKVALRPIVDENGVVGRTEIVKVVKLVMKGEEGKWIRNQMVRPKRFS